LTERRETKETRLREKKKADNQARREGRDPDAAKTPASRGAASSKKGKGKRKRNKIQNDYDPRDDKQTKAPLDSASDEDLTVEQKAQKRENELNNIENMYKLQQD
jgi:hypothetical protein